MSLRLIHSFYAKAFGRNGIFGCDKKTAELLIQCSSRQCFITTSARVCGFYLNRALYQKIFAC